MTIARLIPFLSVLLIGSTFAQAGPYSPAADQPGSTGVSANDPRIIGWATSVVTFTPGPVDITNPGGATASFGTTADVLGPSDATAESPFSVLSLGDGGSITLSFAQPIHNNPGADLAVFENALPLNGVPNAYFMELATVSVSSDGINFFTFPAISLTQTSTQVPSFGTLDPTNLYDLAGSEIVGYGTPFDLSELIGVSPLLDINNITQVRITDVVGSITNNSTLDSLGNIINDPYKTNFNTGGFDLDAVAVLQAVPEPSTWALLAVGVFALFFRVRARNR